MTGGWRGPIRWIPEGNVSDNPEGWARALGVSREAVQLCASSEIIDLHVDSFIWSRVFGYRLEGPNSIPTTACLGQADMQRFRCVGISGAQWVITTNPLRFARDRTEVLRRNVERLRGELGAIPHTRVVRTAAEYDAARKEDAHTAFIALQGGNALDGSPDLAEELKDGWIVRVTLLHLTDSLLGATSAPSPRALKEGLSRRGGELVEALNEARVFVDLAHIHPDGFFKAAEVHRKDLPLIVTHTGVSGVHPHWRNLDDDQLRRIADFGGTVGVMYHSPFLGDRLWRGKIATVLRHLQHIVDTIGEDHASLGSDWDGAIVTPRDMPTCLELPRLVHLMLEAEWSESRIRKVLAGNYLRCFRELRPASCS